MLFQVTIAVSQPVFPSRNEQEKAMPYSNHNKSLLKLQSCLVKKEEPF